MSQSQSQSKNKTKEQQYYRSIFDRFYPNAENVVPYLWMPKYVESNDPSARSLKIYDSLQ
jgi:asparagine synthase (glutamine-hydrolysing)